MPAASADIVVVGAGHAGVEAALAAARLGRTAAVVTLRRAHVGRLSCNPAFGGLAKGHLVREVDALGGLVARAADAATIQFRHLNTRRGLAVRSSRAQVDVDRYPRAVLAALEAEPRVRLLEGEVVDVLVRRGRAAGVRLADGREVHGGAVVLTTGTFLGGVLHRGLQRRPGGREGDPPASRLSDSLRALGLRLGRLKTGTTPRLDGRTVDWNRLEPQADTVPDGHFSFTPPARRLPRKDCWIAWTNPRTHDLVRRALDRSPLFTGAIVGRGPRYCPSIEDKVVRFADRDRHQLYLEPEGLDTRRVYLNGLSTSLPPDVQEQVVRSIEGLERAVVLRPGYAVEYDYADPRDLDPGLQHRGVPGLFLAGQLNGTSGYEEAAAQGLVAGASAALGEPLRIGRDQAYIGVLVDDLVTRGVGGEPYRMFPSRAEHRLLLREDNADRRLMPLARSVGLLPDDAWAAFERRAEAMERAADWARRTRVRPDAATVARFRALGLAPPRQPVHAGDLLRRPEVDWSVLRRLLPDAPPLGPGEAEQVVTDFRYAGYLERERVRAERARRMEAVRIPPGFSFRLPGISTEAAERLEAARPATLGAAARLPGVTPAAVDVIAWHLARAAAGGGRRA